jgi:hypothetical protein
VLVQEEASTMEKELPLVRTAQYKEESTIIKLKQKGTFSNS